MEIKGFMVNTSIQPFQSCALLVYWASKFINFLGCYNQSAFPQCCTQDSGCGPFVMSASTVGFDSSGSPDLHQTDPSGTYQSWKVSVNLIHAYYLSVSKYLCVSTTYMDCMRNLCTESFCIVTECLWHWMLNSEPNMNRIRRKVQAKSLEHTWFWK